MQLNNTLDQNEDTPYCACLRVVYCPEPLPDGLNRERWLCELCGRIFVPRSWLETTLARLRAENEEAEDLAASLHNELEICRRERERLKGRVEELEDTLRFCMGEMQTIPLLNKDREWKRGVKIGMGEAYKRAAAVLEGGDDEINR